MNWLPGDNRVCNRVCMLLVGITLLSDTAIEGDAGPLLDDVRCLMGRRVEVRGITEGDLVATRIGPGTNGCGGIRGLPSYVGLDATDVVIPKCFLNSVQVRYFRARALDTLFGRFVDRIHVPVIVTDAAHLKQAMLPSQNTQAANLYGICAISTPIHHFGANLPVGLQVMCPAGYDSEALAIGMAMETTFGPAPKPDLDAFLG